MIVRIVITDANILIDLIKSELAVILFRSGLFRFKTTDFIFEELYEVQKLHLQPLVESGFLIILESGQHELHEIFKLKQNNKGLSFEDCSAFYFASKFDAILLTGDARLRRHCTHNQIEVHGLIYLFDLIVDKNLISYTEACSKLSYLSKINPRLPHNEVEVRLKKWNISNF